MQLPKDHRKTVRDYDNPSDCHELTFSCYKRLPLLTNDVLCVLAVDWRWLGARHDQCSAEISDPKLPRLDPLPAEFLANADI
ncbi:MAG TPA: hypothetical protein VGY55_22815 [Pirellulales bacterium]|jgi:hypothetical protein|nr:hypothetical protein [Pirellulales bacterium]